MLTVVVVSKSKVWYSSASRLALDRVRSQLKHLHPTSRPLILDPLDNQLGVPVDSLRLKKSMLHVRALASGRQSRYIIIDEPFTF